MTTKLKPINWIKTCLLTALLVSPASLANKLTHNEYADVKIGMAGDNALLLLKDYQSEHLLDDEPNACYYLTPVTNSDGAHIMVMDGIVVRFDVDEQDSALQTEEGIGIGSSKADVIAAYSEVSVSDHPYLGEAGEYLEVKLSNGNGIIFETFEDKITSFRLGSYPAILYIEGCA